MNNLIHQASMVLPPLEAQCARCRQEAMQRIVTILERAPVGWQTEHELVWFSGPWSGHGDYLIITGTLYPPGTPQWRRARERRDR